MGWEFGNSQEVYIGIQESKRELLQHSSVQLANMTSSEAKQSKQSDLDM